jgi:cytochrome P450
MKPRFTENIRTRLSGKLPPAAPLPASLQTLGCRVWPLAYLKWCQRRFGDRFVVYPVDMPPLVFLSKPSEIKAVLAAPAATLHPGVGAAVTAPLFGESSFMLMEEDAHMRVRTAILPPFRREAVRERADVVAELVHRDISLWPEGIPFPSHSFLRALTLRIVLRAVFGAEDRLVSGLHQRMLEMLSVTASLVLQEPRARYLPGWHGTWRRFVRQRRDVDELIFALVRRRIRECPSQEGDVLELLLATRRADGSPMSSRELRDNLVSMIIAGHETTASALAWAFQLLAHNQSAQARLADEIDDDAGDEYLRATIQEVLRHSPVFLFAAPRAVVDSFELGGWTYRRPARLLACTYLMHHDPDLYPDPGSFRPERFLGNAPQPRIWLPWGGGRKVCVGRHMAMLEMSAVLRETLSKYVLLPAGAAVERAHWRSVMVAPHAGSRVVLRARRRRVKRPTPLLEGATV